MIDGSLQPIVNHQKKKSGKARKKNKLKQQHRSSPLVFHLLFLNTDRQHIYDFSFKSRKSKYKNNTTRLSFWNRLLPVGQEEEQEGTTLSGEPESGRETLRRVREGWWLIKSKYDPKLNISNIEHVALIINVVDYRQILHP